MNKYKRITLIILLLMLLLPSDTGAKEKEQLAYVALSATLVFCRQE